MVPDYIPCSAALPRSEKQIFFLKAKSSEHLENLFNFRER
jgi:hypothetical protein